MFGVPRTTLQARLSGAVNLGAKPGLKPKLDFELEKKLIDYANNRAKLGLGFGKSQFLEYTGQLRNTRCR